MDAVTHVHEFLIYDFCIDCNFRVDFEIFIVISKFLEIVKKTKIHTKIAKIKTDFEITTSVAMTKMPNYHQSSIHSKTNGEDKCAKFKS